MSPETSADGRERTSDSRTGSCRARLAIPCLLGVALFAVTAWSLLALESGAPSEEADTGAKMLIPDDLPPTLPATDIARLWAPDATRERVRALAGDGIVIEDAHRIVFDGALGRWPARFVAAFSAPGDSQACLFHNVVLVDFELRKPFFCELLFQESVAAITHALGPAEDLFSDRDWRRFVGGAHWRTPDKLVIAGGRLEFEEEIDDAAPCEVVATIGPAEAGASEADSLP